MSERDSDYLAFACTALANTPLNNWRVLTRVSRSLQTRRAMCRALLLIVVLVACSGMEPVPLETVAGLGPGASLGGRRPFPDDNAWNRVITTRASSSLP